MKITRNFNLFIAAKGQWLVIAAAVFYFFLFLFIGFWKYFNFAYTALDLGIINQVFYNSSLGAWFASSIHPPSYLGDHFSPILFLLLPIYFFYPRPQTLIIFQTAFLALACWPIYLIAKKALDKKWAVVMALAWLVNPIVQNINLFEFSFLPLAVFFILWTFYFYQTKKFRPFLLFAFLALLVREDVALVILMFGLIAFFEKRKLKWWLVPIIISGGYFFLALKITRILAPNGQYKFFVYYAWLGETPALAIKNLLFKSRLVVLHLFTVNNLVFLLGLFLPLVFLPLLNPWYLLLSALIFAQLFLGSGGSMVVLQTHYSSLLLPPSFIAAIYSLKEIIEAKVSEPLRSNGRKKFSREKIVFAIKKYQDLAFLVFIVGLVYASLTLGPLVGSLKKIIETGMISSENLTKQELLKKIPAEAAVASTYEFLAPLSSRRKLYSFNYAFLGKQQFLISDYQLPQDTEYLLINYQDFTVYQIQYGKNPFYQSQYEKALLAWPKILTGFGLIAVKDSLALYQKGAENKFTLVENLIELPPIQFPGTLALADNISFLGYNQAAGFYQLFWQINPPLTKKYQLKLELRSDGKTIYQKIYPFAYDLIYDWKNPGKITTNYWFNFPKEIPAGSYELKISLFQIEKGGIEIDDLRSTVDVIDQKTVISPEISLGQINL
ncbi:MAG: DUF2079 domain-containing protein [Candidatus Buchananbacteria bacterium]